MRKKRNNFLEQIKPKAPRRKPISEMSEQELVEEQARLQAELRDLKEQGAAKPSRFIFAGKPKKRYWK